MVQQPYQWGHLNLGCFTPEQEALMQDKDNNWGKEARCLDDPLFVMDTDWLAETATKPRYSTSVKKLIAHCKGVCKTCPVKLECLNHALMFPERGGVWGGKTDRERTELRRKGYGKKP